MQRRTKRTALWAAAIVVGAATLTMVGVATPARAADDYPYQGEDPSELDSLGFYYRHCTSYVAWRLSQRGPFDNDMNGGHWYHARDWADNALRLGFAVDDNPAVGAVAHWHPGEGGAAELGHVAYVDTVNEDGSVFVEEYNGLNQYAYGRRGPVRAGRYIHVYDAGPVRDTPKTAPSTEDAALPRRIESSVPAPAPRSVPVDIPVDRAPVGRLTSPAGERQLRPGEIVTVSGAFSDDSRVTKVHFFAADEGYRWENIGTDGHGGNGVYSVTWTVSFPAGSKVSLFAEAFDDAGHPAVDSIVGLEGIAVGAKDVMSRPARVGRTTPTLVSHREASPRGRSVARAPVYALTATAVVALLVVVLGVAQRRRRVFPAWRRSPA